MKKDDGLGRKACSIIIVSLVLSSILSSCTDAYTNEESTDKKNRPSISVVYFMERIRSDYLEEACEQFRGLYPDIELKERILEGDTGIQELVGKIPAELAAGNGPDIIISQEGYRSFDIYKAVENGLFTDLNILIKKAEGFNIEDYNNVIMDCGVFDGKRFLIPVWYDMPVFCTSEELMEQNGINIDMNNISWEELSRIAEGFKNDSKQFEANNLFLGLNSLDFFSESGLKYADYILKKPFCDTPEFEKLLETYKKLYSAICPSEIQMKNEGDFSLIKRNQGIMEYIDSCLSPIYLVTTIELFNKQIDGDMLVFKPESMFGGKGFIAEAGDLKCEAMQEQGINQKKSWYMKKYILLNKCNLKVTLFYNCSQLYNVNRHNLKKCYLFLLLLVFTASIVL